MNVSRYGKPDAGVVSIQPVDDHDLEGIENEVAEIQRLIGDGFCLIAIKVGNWNTDLSPWKAPAVFGKEDFGAGAGGTLAEVLKYTADPTKAYYIGGYSLAALFAVWAAYHTDVFNGVAAASPSVWFPGFVDSFMHDNKCRAKAVYLSLGGKEKNTRDPLMAQVEDCTRAAFDLLRPHTKTTFVHEPGGHFRGTAQRLSNAIVWLMNDQSRKS